MPLSFSITTHVLYNDYNVIQVPDEMVPMDSRLYRCVHSKTEVLNEGNGVMDVYEFGQKFTKDEEFRDNLLKVMAASMELEILEMTKKGDLPRPVRFGDVVAFIIGEIPLFYMADSDTFFSVKMDPGALPGFDSPPGSPDLPGVGT